MSVDFRLDVGCCDHPKISRLVRQAGEPAFRCWVRLLGWVASNRPSTGDVVGLADQDIEEVVRWPGEPKAFVRALRTLKLLDGTNRTSRVHDWQEHQPYLAHSDARHAQAQRAAAIRWQQKHADAREHTAGVVSCRSQARGNAKSKAGGNAPCPDPRPSPSPGPSPIPRPAHNREREASRARVDDSAIEDRGVRRTPWPEDFQLDPELWTFAKKAGCDPDAEFAAFHDHCLALGKEFSDFRRAFMGWVRKTDTFGQAPPISQMDQNPLDRFHCVGGDCHHVCHHKGCAALPSEICKYINQPG